MITSIGTLLGLAFLAPMRSLVRPSTSTVHRAMRDVVLIHTSRFSWRLAVCSREGPSPADRSIRLYPWR